MPAIARCLIRLALRGAFVGARRLPAGLVELLFRSVPLFKFGLVTASLFLVIYATAYLLPWIGGTRNLVANVIERDAAAGRSGGDVDDFCETRAYWLATDPPKDERAHRQAARYHLARCGEHIQLATRQDSNF